MQLPRAAAEFHAFQKAISSRTVSVALNHWRRVDPRDLDGSWRLVSQRMRQSVSNGMVIAASQADVYLDRLGVLDSAGAVAPAAFGQSTLDGRFLDDALFDAVIAAKTAVAKQRPDFLDVGRRRLAQVVATQVADSARQSVASASVARPEVQGYVRVLSPPSCSRCVVLAGATYRWNDGFKRHPLCDCDHLPTTQTPDETLINPKSYFGSLSTADQDRYFTKQGAAAIRDGADMAQVVNVRQGMYTTADRRSATTQGRQSPRLMPEQIYTQAPDRETAVALLKEHGYLV